MKKVIQFVLKFFSTYISIFKVLFKREKKEVEEIKYPFEESEAYEN